MSDLFGHYRISSKLIRLYKSIRIKNPEYIIQIEDSMNNKDISQREGCARLVAFSKALLKEEYLDNYLETILKNIFDDYDDLMW